MKRSIGLFLIILLCLPPAYVAFGVWNMGHRSLGEMDWDGNGHTSVSEIITAMDVVKIPSRDGTGCVEYRDAKTGSHVYAVRCAPE